MRRAILMFLSRAKKLIKNEQGAISLEFIGILPFLFLFMLLLWQAVASGIGIVSAQSAVNEAAKVYAASHDRSEARQKAKEIIGTGDIMTYNSLSITTPDGRGNFKAVINVDLDLVFIPDGWKQKSAVPFSISTTSRVMH